MIVHSGYDERYFAHFVHSSKNKVREQFRKSFTVKRIGGRGRDRTGDPLLAKQVLSQLSYTPTREAVLILKHFPTFLPLHFMASSLDRARTVHLSPHCTRTVLIGCAATGLISPA